MTDVTRDAILTAMTSLILGYKDKYNPGTETEALDTLRRMLPEGASLLTIGMILGKIFNAYKLAVNSNTRLQDLLTATDDIVKILSDTKLQDKNDRRAMFLEDLADRVADKVKEKLPPAIGTPYPYPIPVPDPWPYGPGRSPLAPYITPQDPWAVYGPNGRFPSDPQVLVTDAGSISSTS